MNQASPPKNPPMTIRSAVFVKSALEPEHYPAAQLPEIAFAGRSNVGKSSLINCLLQRKKLVRTSRTPGRTQMINFFAVNDAFMFVDLPGYGYARVAEKVRRSWGPMVETYLRRRHNLKAIVQIIDLRHPPTADDLQLWNWLCDSSLEIVGVLTKADKVKRGRRPQHVRQAALALGVDPRSLIVFSAVSRQGRDALWQRLTPLLSAT